MSEPETTPPRMSRSTRLIYTMAPVGLVVAAIAVGIAGSGSDVWLLSTLVVLGTKDIGPNARHTKITSDLQTIQKVATGIHTETDQWPVSIDAMVNARDANGNDLMNSLEEMPKDPWGHEYNLAIVTCLGSDNAPGGEGEAADVVRPEWRESPQ